MYVRLSVFYLVVSEERISFQVKQLLPPLLMVYVDFPPFFLTNWFVNLTNY